MDTSELKEIVEPDVLADYLGLDYQEKSGHFLILCPFHGDRNLGSAYLRNGYFHCFSCGESMDIISLVMQVKNVSFYKAVKILGNLAGVTVDFSENNNDGYWRVRLNQEELDVLQFPKSSISLRKIFAASHEKYKALIIKRTEAKKEHYQFILEHYAERFSPDATKVCELYGDDFSPQAFRDIKAEAQRRLRICNNILERFE